MAFLYMESDHRNPGGDRKGIWIKELFEQLRLLFMFQQSEMISTPYPGLITKSIFVLLPFGKKFIQFLKLTVTLVQLKGNIERFDVNFSACVS